MSEPVNCEALDWNAMRLETRIQRLANGLTVVVHRDPKTPLVAVLIGYRAGSRDEPAGQAGLAHLCEHLMFTGTRAAPGSYFAPFERAGAASMNAYVKEDYSAYFATVPVAALDFALKMEADRMAHLAAALDSAFIDRQREVVRNELRQREAIPYGYASRLLAAMTRPVGHPYGHPPDGLVAELDNIFSDDVRRWLELHHCPANATLVIAGDIEPAAVIEQARGYFEPIPSGVALSRPRCAEIEQLAAGHIGQQPTGDTQLTVVWNGPVFASPDFACFELACEIIAGGRTSLLWRRIVKESPLAQEISLELRPRELGSLAILNLTPCPGVSSETVSAAIYDEIRQLESGLNQHELDLAHLRLFARYTRELERIGGPRSKSDALGLAALLGGDAQLHDQRMLRIASAEIDQVAAIFLRWLFAGWAVFEMRSAQRLS